MGLCWCLCWCCAGVCAGVVPDCRLLIGIGIRIEDDVLITADGPCNLTERCPKSVRDVEAAIGCRVSH